MVSPIYMVTVLKVGMATGGFGTGHPYPIPVPNPGRGGVGHSHPRYRVKIKPHPRLVPTRVCVVGAGRRWSNSSPKVLKISVEAMIEVLDRALLGFFMAFTSTNNTFSLQTPQTSTGPYLHFLKNISKLEIPLQDRCH